MNKQKIVEKLWPIEKYLFFILLLPISYQLAKTIGLNPWIGIMALFAGDALFSRWRHDHVTFESVVESWLAIVGALVCLALYLFVPEITVALIYFGVGSIYYLIKTVRRGFV